MLLLHIVVIAWIIFVIKKKSKKYEKEIKWREHINLGLTTTFVNIEVAVSTALCAGDDIETIKNCVKTISHILEDGSHHTLH